MKNFNLSKAVKKVFGCCTAVCLVLFLQLTAKSQTLKNGSGAFATGKYRNLFKEQGHSEKEISAKITNGFNQLFYGDTATQAIYFPVEKNVNGPMAYITDVPHFDIRTEGMSYGMMIAVQLNKKKEFDALWNYAMSKMYISSKNHPSEGYFSWSLKRNGVANEETPAPDGEEYFVMSLYFASGRWGNGKGIYNYHAWADKILTAMRHRKYKTGMTKSGIRNISAMVNEQHKMIRFVPGIDGGDFTDPSYHLPAFYELWARYGPVADRKFWASAADTSRNFFIKATNAETGLAPDYASFDGKPYDVEWNKNAVNFSFDSWRTASNWSVDWNWWHKDPRQQALSNKIQAFFVSKGVADYGAQFSLDGSKTLDTRHASGLIATTAVASLAATNPQAKVFVKELWELPVPHLLVERYYDGLLYLMSMLHCSGRYQIYLPK
ncbi:MAG: glycoside hydrolase [Sphingobacteriaceae bacterium]|nr:MAG: glycoside hydrolase [Sphingobacteriaceae bacterium]